MNKLKPLSEKVTIELTVIEAYMLFELVKEAQEVYDITAWSNVKRVIEKAIAQETNQ